MKRGRSYFTLDSRERWVLNDDLLYRSLLKEPGFDALKAQILPCLPEGRTGGRQLALKQSRDGRMIPILHSDGSPALSFQEVTIQFTDADEKTTWTQVPVILGGESCGPELDHLEAHVWHVLNRRHRSPEDYSPSTPAAGAAARKPMARTRDLPRSLARILRWLIEAEYEAAQRWTRWESPDAALERVYLPLGLVTTLGMVDGWLKKGRLPPIDRCHEAVKSQLEDSFAYSCRKSTIDLDSWKNLYDATFTAVRDDWKQRGAGYLDRVQQALAGKDIPEGLLTAPEKFFKDAGLDPCLEAMFPAA